MNLKLEERQQKLDRYKNAYNQLADALDRYPEVMWAFKPGPARWSGRARLPGSTAK